MNTRKELNFASIMNKARKEKGISLQGLSELIGTDESGKPLVSQSYLSRLQNNEYITPSITNVLLITEKLGLDVNEVIKSFGFSTLLEECDDLDIEQTILKYDILAPLEQDGGATIDYEFLDEKEKEILISIIDSVFTMGVCLDERVMFNLSCILKDLEKYRNMRKDKVKIKYTNNLNQNELNITFAEGIEIQLDEFSITKEEIIETIIENKDDIPQKNSGFMLVHYEKLIGILCYKKGNEIKVFSLSKVVNIEDLGKPKH